MPLLSTRCPKIKSVILGDSYGTCPRKTDRFQYVKTTGCYMFGISLKYNKTEGSDVIYDFQVSSVPRDDFDLLVRLSHPATHVDQFRLASETTPSKPSKPTISGSPPVLKVSLSRPVKGWFSRPKLTGRRKRETSEEFELMADSTFLFMKLKASLAYLNTPLQLTGTVLKCF